MAVKRGKLLSLSTTNSKSSSTVTDTSIRYGGLTEYQIKSSGRKSRGENVVGLATYSKKVQQIQPNKHWTLTHKERQHKEGQKSAGDAPHYKMGVTWQEAKVLAQKRVRWRNMVDALCS